MEEWLIEVIVHGFDTPEERAEVRSRVAKIQAEYVIDFINKLDCPLEQKLQIADAVIEGCRERAVEEEKEIEAYNHAYYKALQEN